MTTETNATDDKTVDPPAKPTGDDWYNSLDDTQKGYLDERTKGLKAALDAERDANRDKEKQLKELKSKAEKGSVMEQELDKQIEAVKTERQRADFYEQAATAGVKNPKLAWYAVQAEDLTNKDGTPNMNALKEAHPELFERPAPNAKAGAGAGTNVNTSNDVDALLRKKFKS